MIFYREIDDDLFQRQVQMMENMPDKDKWSFCLDNEHRVSPSLLRHRLSKILDRPLILREVGVRYLPDHIERHLWDASDFLTGSKTGTLQIGIPTLWVAENVLTERTVLSKIYSKELMGYTSVMNLLSKNLNVFYHITQEGLSLMARKSPTSPMWRPVQHWTNADIVNDPKTFVQVVLNCVPNGTE